MKLGLKKIWNSAEPWSINLWLIVIFLVSSTITRLALMLLNFGDIKGTFYLIPVSLAIGVIFDLFIALCVSLPFVFVLMIFPARWRSFSVIKWFTMITAFLFIFGNLYLGVVELFFFGEFSSRFNYVAVDYLIYPHEVFVNIWDTYPVLTVLIITGIISLFLIWLLGKHIYRSLQAYPKSFLHRFGIMLLYCLLIVAMFFALGSDTARISDNRILNEISLNGIYTFFYAGFTNELDYNQYYETMDKSAAFKRLRKLVGDRHSTFLKDDNSDTIVRLVTSDRELHRYNIVLVLEESFGSNFIGALHPEKASLTPQFDSLIQKSMFFSHIYATGNRTVRGLEASLISFPPIPGRSIVKRPENKDMFTLPALLKEEDYNTVFLYGGLSYFDNFGQFAANNGFEQIIDEIDFKNPIFSTIWGVCDEDLFSHALTVFDTLSAKNKPFFATLITVSNHSPYTYPTGRIPYDPEDRRRENSVRYADYAIGKFINDAKSYDFFDSTLFIFLADHGARVYGSEEIPMRSYQIPILFYCPKLIPEGVNIDLLGSQMDLSPTILDLLGFEYDSEFFGHSLLSTPKSDARVLMSHNRDVSLMKNDTVVVLNIQGGHELWNLDTSGVLKRLDDTIKSPLIEDAIAYYMTAYNMSQEHQLHPLDQKSFNR